jgi:ABC-type siderophore export system fused ATPase/permease subunit
VISHDDRYFHRADVLVKLERGRLREVSRPTATVPNTSTDRVAMS